MDPESRVQSSGITPTHFVGQEGFDVAESRMRTCRGPRLDSGLLHHFTWLAIVAPVGDRETLPNRTSTILRAISSAV